MHSCIFVNCFWFSDPASTIAAEEISAAGGSIPLCLFFFQAEDGIRYLTVTGVQTCALPIFALRPAGLDARPESRRQRLRVAPLAHPAGLPLDHRLGQAAHRVDDHGPREAIGRSEERRVGKEGRSRWSPYH